MADTTINNIPDDVVYSTIFGAIIAKRGDKTIISDPATPPTTFKTVERRVGGKTYTLTLTVA